MMKKGLYVYTAVLTPEADGGYLITVPDVPGCVTSGKDMADAILTVKDALCGCLCTYEDEGVELSTPRLPKDIPLDNPESFVALVEVDTQRYRMETDNRAIRTNVSIPAWLKYQAEKAGINYSQVLQDALKSQLNIG